MKAGVRRQVTLAMTLALVAAGCRSTATITRPDGMPVRAQIVASDANGLVIRNEADGSISRMERADVNEVSHPGKLVMLSGAGLLGIWGALFAVSPPFRQELIHGPHGDVWVMALPITLAITIPAAIVMGAGWYRYYTSLSAASAFDAAPARYELMPLPPGPTRTPVLAPPAALVVPVTTTKAVGASTPPADAPPPLPPPAWPSARSPVRGDELPPPS